MSGVYRIQAYHCVVFDVQSMPMSACYSTYTWANCTTRQNATNNLLFTGDRGAILYRFRLGESRINFEQIIVLSNFKAKRKKLITAVNI